ncbi:MULTISPECIES: hypothetical protein [unclassified Bradyrhizobium]|uniref:hypothetical protein n=1 Tax=unclassified Bradyrhizobium TaxID=2631580 RepID=UPI001FF810F1|nr:MULTISPECIES: hypothetical protein [unclassified Bradyrhizobium]MCK1316018.1 hypothetical protein [Bradyrhizobium sp. 23]MCK1397593.1 hypothetical protein [Bradyrhizobium sp. 39]MCK1749147.1 hypothetical protein [Bradyrhizobium sp. 135]UPJ39155.1 hypothetical protein IVB45_37235 [Bradyrhizobium sp. 4]
MTPDALAVSAAIRLSPVDSIGVPIFWAGNSMYLPEMDADFNISAFLHFDNADGYELTGLIPDTYRQRLFRIGDPAPIIFWVDQAPYIVEGDAEKAKLEEIFGTRARTHPVLKDLGGMLHDARTGVFKRQQEEWLARELEVAYGDVFLEPPSRTKYWIHRYRVALENARKLTQPPHPIDVRLRRASTEWLEKFATKTELPMISALLGEASQGVYSVRQIAEIMFAYLSNKLSAARPVEINKITSDQTIRALFPHGMYDFYIQDGWPHAPFQYGKLDFVDLMKERLVQGSESWTWAPALQLAKLLFGDKDVPPEVEDVAMIYMRPILTDYKRLLDELANQYTYKGEPISSEGILERSNEVIDLFDRIQELGRVIVGADRDKAQMMDGRFQVSESQVRWYRAFLES